MDSHGNSGLKNHGATRRVSPSRLVRATLFLSSWTAAVGWWPAAQPTLPPEDKATATGPRIQVAEMAHDFGRVVAGTLVQHTFRFTNAGDQVLEVTDVRSTCGCTTSAAWSKRVEPGQEGVIPVEFRTGGFDGPVSKPITVGCNDPTRSNVVLELKANAWHPIRVTPPSAGLRVVGDQVSNAVAVLQIVNNEPTPLTLSEPESDQSSIVAALRTVAPGQSFELTVKPRPPVGPGNVFGNITLRTSSTNLPVLTISSWIVAQPAVTVNPTLLRVPPGPAPEAFTRDISVRNLGTAPLSLSKPALDLPGVEGQVLELQPGKLFTVRLSFPKGFELPPGQSPELRVESDHPQFRVIRVPILRATAPTKPTTAPPPKGAG